MTTDSSKKVDEIMALVDKDACDADIRAALESAVIDPAAVREAIAREVDEYARWAGYHGAAAFIRQIPLDKLRGE